MGVLLAVLMVIWSAVAMADTKAAIDRAFDAAAQANGAFALGAGMTQDGQVHLRVAGPLHRRAARMVGQNAAWHVGSIGKSFTASVVMRLVEQGVLSLDAPIGPVLGNPADMHPDWRALNLRQLLSHTAGVRPNPTQRVLWANTMTRRSAVERYWSAPLSGQGAHAYSNLGYVLVGVVIEAVTGSQWEDTIRSEIAKPLGLQSLGFGSPTGEGDPWGHRRILGQNLRVDPRSSRADNPAWLGPAGTIHLSLPDLLVWGQTHLAACAGRSAFLNAQSCRVMQTIVRDDYGLGWVVRRDGALVWHNGSNSMWYAVLALVPDQDLTLAVVTNRGDGRRAEAFLQEFLAILNP